MRLCIVQRRLPLSSLTHPLWAGRRGGLHGRAWAPGAGFSSVAPARYRFASRSMPASGARMATKRHCGGRYASHQPAQRAERTTPMGMVCCCRFPPPGRRAGFHLDQTYFTPYHIAGLPIPLVGDS
ncbi:hypothetical protein SAMN05216320_104236 [Duganella sp. OV458]|nr:hypothetical protein SAMN05216320_104236 [Duganella sp. OV458]SDJ62855.1 hypothetical protein SAMN05428973_105167 [Duganella sp. OV510]